jgi:uncharacterized damage-inducible protein DinB
MSELHGILDQMDRAFFGDAWHGPALAQLLEGISAEDAARHPIRGVHSIGELVNHIAAWNAIAARRLAGERVDVTPEVDWPSAGEADDVEWRRSLDRLMESRARLRSAVEGLSEEQLAEKPEGQKESRYILLHGVIQHDLYHAGQIAILKKALQ